MNRFLSVLLSAGISAVSRADVAVLMQHNNLAHTGANLAETTLNTSNVNTNSFGLLYSRPVDDQIYTQPLILTNVDIPGKGAHNLVVVATVNDTIYAFDADDASVTEPYWKKSFISPPNIVPPNRADISAMGACGGNYVDFTGNIGIVGTPAVDPATGTLYFIARTKEPGNKYVQRLHALDFHTGEERPHSPTIITATYPGTGDGSVNGVLTFDPVRENQRSALALINGVVYIGWSSHCDMGPYHGWILGYDPTNLTQVVVYNDTPNGNAGGVWMSDEGISADEKGNLYLSTGNGSVGYQGNPRDVINRGESFLKLVRQGSKLVIASWFTPADYQTLENGDVDLGSAGLLLIPGTSFVFSGGKEGVGYLVNRDRMGGLSYSSQDTNILQSFRMSGDQIHGSMVWWDSPSGSFGYMWPASVHLQQYLFDREAERFALPAFAQSPTSAPGGQPGGILALSADGAKAGSGILWAVHQLIGDANHYVQPGFLHAYDAQDIGKELWNSEQISSRDHVVSFSKFAPPTIANGKVYLATFSGQLDIYGLATGWVAAPTINPVGGTFTNSVTVTINDATAGVKVFYTTDGSAPTTNSTLYQGPFTLNDTTAVKAKAFKSGFVDSGVAVTTLLNSSALGHGTGLLGEYFSNQAKTFTNPPTLTRTDATVNFNWHNGSPAEGISADTFTARWSGTVQPLVSDTYTFYTMTDDGGRLWVNNQQIINNWKNHPASEQSGTIALVGQQRYNIRMEYYENVGGAEASLSWSTPLMDKAVIPQSQLYPATNPPPMVTLTSPTDGSVYTGSASVTIAASAACAFNTLDKINFYTNGVLLGSLTNTSAISSNTLALTVTGLGAGDYLLKAVAWDLSGLASASAPVTVTVHADGRQSYGMTTRAPVAPFLNMPTRYSGGLPQKLSLTGVFSDTAKMQPAPGLIPYSLNAPSWSDGAIKTFYVAIPNHGAPFTSDEQINFTPTGQWTFPAGSVFVRTFELATNESNPALTRRLETQLLVRNTNGAVYGVTYKWREDNSDADLLMGGDTEDISITTATGTRTQTWTYSSPSDCMVCHAPVNGFILGMNTRQLNGKFTYPATGKTDNQLRTLNRLGLLNPAIDEARVEGYDHLSALTNTTASLEDRVRSYLDANCAECHRPGGTGVTTDTRYETPLAKQNIINAVVSRGNFGYTNARVVVPHDLNQSILWQRMNTTNVLLKMPNLAHNLVDSNALKVTAQWINSLP